MMNVDVSLELIGLNADSQLIYGIVDEKKLEFRELDYLSLIERLRGRNLQFLKMELSNADEKNWMGVAEKLDVVNSDYSYTKRNAIRNYLNVCKELKIKLERNMERHSEADDS